MRYSKQTVTRRQVIKTGAAAVFLPTLIGNSPAFAATPMRKNIDSLSAQELDDYKHAVKILVDRGVAMPNATNGYAWQARLHNDFERVRGDGCAGACEHRSEFFFPWHRAHLAGFEALLRAADPPRTANVALPYWDWSTPATGVRFPKAFEEPGSILLHSGRYQTVTPQTPRIEWDANAIKMMAQEGDWLLFAGDPLVVQGSGACPNMTGGSYGSVEKGPHNTIHGQIGPTMGDPESASRDPIYWSFHAYIDLIWARWQRVNTSANRPQPFTNPTTKIWVEPFTPVVGEMAQTHTLPTGYAYQYDYDFSIDPQIQLVAEAPPVQRTLNAVAKGERTLTVPALTVAGTKRRLLRLRDVAVLRDLTYTIRAYVHPPAVDIQSLAQNDRARYLADSATVWKSRHAHHPTNVNFDLTKAISSFGQSEFAISVMTEANPLPQNAAEFESARTTLNARVTTSSGPLWRSLVLEER